MYQLTDRLDVVTTAIRRPELLELTYRSFFSRLVGLPSLRIIINIDPLGSGSAEACVEIARQYASDVVWRCPQSPGFMDAVKWCYDQVNSATVLHLEDDWLLKRDLDFKEWESELLFQDLAQLVLLMKKPRLRSSLGYSFRPHLCRSDRIVPVVRQLHDLDANPEKSLIDHKPALASADFLAGGDRLILDMGRKWAKGQGLKKSACQKHWFTYVNSGLMANLEYQAHRAYWSSMCLRSSNDK